MSLPAERDHDLAEDLHRGQQSGPTEQNESGVTDHKKRKQAPAGDKDAAKKPKVQENRAIYITNLPLDATKEEIAEEFKKYGIIDEGLDGTERIKMYADDDGNFKGEALVVYFKPDSVSMAVRMADDYWFRAGDDTKISVKPADTSYRKHKEGAEINLARKDKKASQRTRAKLNQKLVDWDSDDEVAKEVYAAPLNKWARNVILNHMFTLKELEEDATAILDIKEDVREDAVSFGEVTNVILYDKEPEGILIVRFKQLEDAQKFQKAKNGLTFEGRKVDAWLAEDRPKYKKTKTDDPEPEDD